MARSPRRTSTRTSASARVRPAERRATLNWRWMLAGTSGASGGRVVTDRKQPAATSARLPSTRDVTAAARAKRARRGAGMAGDSGDVRGSSAQCRSRLSPIPPSSRRDRWLICAFVHLCGPTTASESRRLLTRGTARRGGRPQDELRTLHRQGEFRQPSPERGADERAVTLLERGNLHRAPAIGSGRLEAVSLSSLRGYANDE